MKSSNCFFVSDIHGSISRYKKLIEEIKKEKPAIVFFGGDLLPHALRRVEGYNDFTNDFLIPEFVNLKNELKDFYPEIFLILGNDDFRSEENKMIEAEKLGIWKYVHYKKSHYENFKIFGYTYVPITPFRIKDWEKYDITENEIRPGCIPISDGFTTVKHDYTTEQSTIEKDLEFLTRDEDLSNAIFIMHSPPYNTYLDRAGLDGIKIENKPLDVHVGSEAIRKFIEEKQPLLTLHGHIHESTARTGHWKQEIGKTVCMNVSHGGQELCLVKFNLDKILEADRILL
ncbi:MAG: metallophosphoesterase [Bacteroidales bacterium]|nr:metallophosphoesterase [Bacteroidales bacterium]